METMFDDAKAEAFAGKLLEAFNNTGAIAMTSVAYALGLFETMAGAEPATIEEITKKTGLQKRYVRELLSGLAASGTLEYDPAAKTFVLPAEHAAFLTRAAGPNNFGHMTQYIPMMLRNHDKLLDAIRNGGGVGYEDFLNFAELQGEESTPLYDAALIDVIIPFAPGIVERLTSGIRVLEVGCGVGHACNLVAKAFPNSTVIGIDFNEEAITIARKEAADLGLTNATFEVSDIASLDGTYDLIFALDVIHDLAQPAKVLSEIASVLADGGTFLAGDINASSVLEENFSHPMGAGLYFFSLFHCMTVSLAQGGVGLGTVWGTQKANEMLREAGFASIEQKEIEGDFFHVFYVAKK
jgi:2-polyprenyl-3-methyl-5-hydroxy-6-metoxy-1,4-benzoquinol methylase